MVEKTESFNEIEEVWNELYRGNKLAKYYQSSEYMRTSWENLAPYRFILRVKPVFYIFSQDKKAIFILPLFKEIFRNKYVLYGRKAGLGYLDGIYRDNISIDDITKCFDALKTKVQGISIDVEHVRESVPFGKWLLKNGGRISEEGCTELMLPDSYEDYYGSLSKHMKQNIRTAYNRLKTDKGEFEIQYYDYTDMPDELYAKLQGMYIDRQVIKYGKSGLYSFFVKYVDLGTKIQKAKKIKEKAFVLYINGKIAAFYDAIYDERETVIVPRLAIADGFNRYSPGVMLINESIKTLIEGGIKCVDLTHGTEPYKLSMGGISHKCVEGEIKL